MLQLAHTVAASVCQNRGVGW